MNFSDLLKNFQDLFERHLQSDLPESSRRPARLHEAINYSLRAGGKRLRPVLVFAGHRLFPSNLDPVMAALAVEIIHTYSLIHDDLPAMDNSDLRRGRPSCHRAFDEATAILAGDAMIPLAFQQLVNGYREWPDRSLTLVGLLAEAAGSEKLVAGQVEDLLAEGKTPDAEMIQYIHANKTAAMIEVSLQMGFCLGGKYLDDELFKLVGEAGKFLGLAFQSIDDLLDATQTTEQLGKIASSDKDAGKMTWVTLLGVKKAHALAEEYTNKAIASIEKIGGDNQFLLDLAKHMLQRKK